MDERNDILLEETVEEAAADVVLEEEGPAEGSLKGQRKTAFKWIGIYTGSAVAAALVPGNFSHAKLLKPLQVTMLSQVSKAYGVNGTAQQGIGSTLLRLGMVEKIGRTVFNYLSKVPGLQVIGIALNAAVAGVVTFFLGTITAVLDERILKGDIDVNNVDWEKYIGSVVDEYLPKYGPKFAQAFKNKDAKTILKNLSVLSLDVFKAKKKNRV